MTNAPLSRMKEEFGTKDKLVDAIVAVVERGDEEKDALRKRLLAASNRKLLRLHSVAARAKELGGKTELVSKILDARGRAKDKDYAARIGQYSVARLLDLYLTGERAKAPSSPAPKRAAKKKGKAASA
jgi:hypothetical protein